MSRISSLPTVLLKPQVQTHGKGISVVTIKALKSKG